MPDPFEQFADAWSDDAWDDCHDKLKTRLDELGWDPMKPTEADPLSLELPLHLRHRELPAHLHLPAPRPSLPGERKYTGKDAWLNDFHYQSSHK